MLSRVAPLRQIYCLLHCLCLCTLPAWGNPDSLLQVQIDKATQLFSSNPQEALSILRAAAQSSEYPQAGCVVRSSLLHKTGVCFFRLGNYQMALSYFRDQALPLRASCLGQQHMETANTTYNVAIMYRNLGDPNAEAEYLRRSIGILEKLPNSQTVDNYLSRNYKEAAELFRRQGDFATAKRYLNGSKALLEKSSQFRGEEKALWLRRWGTLQGDLKEYRIALDALLQAQNAYQQTDSTVFRSAIADCLHEMGLMYYYLKNYDQAAHYCARAMQLRAGLPNQNENLSAGYELTGNIQKRKHLYRKALKSFKTSLSLRQKIGHTKGIANAWENMGDVYMEMGQLAKGLDCYAKGSQSPNRSDLIRVGLLRAEALRKEGVRQNDPRTLSESLRLYQWVDSIATELRLFYQGHETKTALLANVHSFYESAIQTAYQLAERTKETQYLEIAYRFCAKNKAVLLLDRLSELDAKAVGLPDSVAARETALRQRCQQLLSEGSPDFDAERLRYQHFVQDLEQRYPLYHQLKHQPFEVLPSAILQQSLSNDAAMLEYFVGGSAVYLFLTTPQKGLQVFFKPLPPNFGEQCRQWRSLAESVEPGQTFETYPTLGNNLAQILLWPALAALPEAIQRLCLVPDGPLLGLPFDIFPTETVAAWQGAQTPILLKRFALSQTFSSQWLLRQKRRNQPLAPDTKLFGGFGLEYDEATLKALLDASTPTDTALFKRNVGKLYFSDDEIKESATLWDGDAWVNQSATKANFLSHFSEYRILHLAMHGLLNPENPMQSALVFSKDGNNGDFKLHLAEIFGLQLPAQLAVLSACNTYDGPSVPGEGLQSLALAFAHAGCPSIMANQWSASDQASKDLILRFYAYLGEGTPMDIALQRAKLEYMANTMPTFSAPSYWANLVLIGDAGQVANAKGASAKALTPSSQNNSTVFLWLFGVLACFALTWGAVRFWGKQ